MHTYKTLNQMETDASEQTLDHVLKHPFFAKKSSLQEKISTPKESDGHDHSSETMNQYKGQHEKSGVDVTKAKPKKRPSESGNVEQQKNAQSANDIDELEQLDELHLNLQVGATVAMKDKRNKMLYGKVEELEKVMGKPGVVVRWSDGKSGRFQMSAFAGLRMDKKADYIVSEEVTNKMMESCGCGEVKCSCGEVKDVTDVKKSYKSLRQQKEEKVDGRTKAYKETYSRIMSRLNAIREKAKATQKETFQGK